MEDFGEEHDQKYADSEMLIEIAGHVGECRIEIGEVDELNEHMDFEDGAELMGGEMDP